MKELELNEKISELKLLRVDGKIISLRQFLGKPVLLIFLRHLA